MASFSSVVDTARWMDVGNPDEAAQTLERINYYLLSGYLYPFRQLVSGKRADDFYPNRRLADVVGLL